MRDFRWTKQEFTPPIMVTLFMLTVLAAVLAGSAIASAQGNAPDTPNRPTGTAVFVGGVDLEWNDVSGADSYDVQLYQGGGWTDLPGNGIEIAFYGAGAIISGLDPTATLWFQVRARNAHGASDWSEYGQLPPRPSLSGGDSPGLTTCRPVARRSSVARPRWVRP